MNRPCKILRLNEMIDYNSRNAFRSPCNLQMLSFDRFDRSNSNVCNGYRVLT